MKNYQEKIRFPHNRDLQLDLQSYKESQGEYYHFGLTEGNLN